MLRTRFDFIRQQFATDLYRFGMFKDKTKSPEGKGFRLKLHQSKPDAPLSPYYIDLRILRSYPNAKGAAVDLFQEMMTGIECDLLADVPTAITPIVSSLSDDTKIPMITPRAPKDHGGGGTIDGVWPDGGRVLLFDDLVTEANSALDAVKTLRANNLVVEHFFVLLDREQGGKERLNADGVTLHSAFTISELLYLYRSMGTLNEELYRDIETYRAQTQASR